ncbi:hypothetical protein KB206_16970 [Microvirga sp. STS02]|uniref:hypothetical protein n=1 Tax=Hymenobacter negativus TaxID=2795026 RepID=UPI0018DEA333|nr:MULTISPECIES: hypothetical protein [Bacteria]MBH8570587.1 hypothetical protein [Hymenobacter negativus]MBR7210325.1 hypothetical protein [Microvirga sp. STS02]
MSVNPIEDNTTPKTTGSLEELFRHHLGEEAAVPPRPMLWDQIDNSLLIRQNETYRRRLVATRWVAAASLLLATLAGTGWWASRTNVLGGAEIAANTGNPSGRATTTATLGMKKVAGQPTASLAANGSAAGANGATFSGKGFIGNGTSANNNANGASADNQGFGTINRGTVAAATQAKYTGFGPASAARYSAGKRAAAESTSQSSLALEGHSVTTDEALTSTTNPTAAPTHSDEQAPNRNSGRMLAAADVATTTAAGTSAAIGGTASATGSGISASTSLATTASAATVAPEEVSLLAARQSALSLSNTTTLPNGLATVSVEDLPAIDAHRWHYGASYTAGVFNPNVNFSRAGIEPEFDYDRGPAFGTDSPKLTEVAATEYRNNLRPGLSQRIALLATRHLRGHWSLSTGAELSQATAQSASSSSFVGEQLFDLGQGSKHTLHTTNFRYNMASIPLEVRYTIPVKRGWSLYGRLGGVVTALLGVRSDVQGDPEATRTYSIASTGGPYRRVMGSLRGGAGTQFRTGTGKWAFTVGPVAEIGLVALNAHPVQSYFAQSHPYSFGLEAGVEFGR